MNKLRLYILFLILFLNLQGANANEVVSYKPLSPAVEPLIKKFRELKTNEPLDLKVNELIHENLNKNWKKPEPVLDIKLMTPYQMKNFMEGTGTRGGGSGLLVKRSETFTEVQLLEIFRSEHLAEYNLFFPIDDELKKIEVGRPADEAAQLIFETVLKRISGVAPYLASKIETLYRDELPFKKWIPIYDDLPLVDDEVKYPLEKNTQKIQIASRRTQYVIYNTRAYAAMSPLNRAALWLHEYIYALSGLESSVKTQRAVSLFFSSDFLSISSDIPKLTQLFFELELLSISRRTISGSLSPGATLSGVKQDKYCSLLVSIKGTPGGPAVDVTVLIDGLEKTLSLDRSIAITVFNSILWSKKFLRTSFPLYKYPGHKIMPDRICFDSGFTKITQVQSSLAIDEDLSLATKNAALAEVEYYRAKSALIEAVEAKIENSKAIGKSAITELFEDIEGKRLQRFNTFLEVEARSITPAEKIFNPKILGEYSISIERGN